MKLSSNNGNLRGKYLEEYTININTRPIATRPRDSI